ncbi:hypothetical protein DL96DRAFT_1596831 [Flagelloscypha sp. PMI_526]|nr:hypothetical protein DL96DRAFT_1596831 [Flagelloscypha sp. PMI_526]
MSTKDDPRDASLEASFTLPPTYYRESYEGLATSGMMLSGLIMVTRNRFLAWPSLILGLNGYVNQHPMRAKDGASSALSNMVMVGVALFASYLPFFMVSRTPAPTY